MEDAVRLGRDGFLVRKGNVKLQEERSVLADSTLFNVFDFPLVSGDKNTALREPMSIILSQTTAKNISEIQSLWVSNCYLPVRLSMQR